MAGVKCSDCAKPFETYSREAVQVVHYKGYHIAIVPDGDPENPRTEWDNATVMLAWHSRYSLGDVEASKEINPRDFSGEGELLKAIEEKYHPVAIRTLYLYDHSSQTISAGKDPAQGFDPGGWDTSRIGFILVSREQALKEMGTKRITPKAKKWAQDVIDAEVSAYNDYLHGNVYGVVVSDPKGEDCDSCWGYFPNESGKGDPYGMNFAIEEAKSTVDSDIKEKDEQRRNVAAAY